MAKIQVITTYKPHEIIQELIYHEEFNTRRQVDRTVINLQEHGIIKALTALGWKPPPKEKTT